MSTLPALTLLWLTWAEPDVRLELRAVPVLTWRGPRVVGVRAEELELAVVWRHW